MGVVGLVRRVLKFVLLGLAVAALLAAAALVALGLVAGRPHAVWEVHAIDNSLSVHLVAGQGPFAGWLLNQASVSAEAEHGHSLSVSLAPGRTSDFAVVVDSLWTTRQRVDVTVPPQPELTASEVAGSAVTLSFSTPIQPRNAPCGLLNEATYTPTLAFPRLKDDCSDSLEVVDTNGEHSVVPVTVPAMPPPPPPPPPAPPAVPREIFNGPPQDGVFYITIDDGWFPNNDVLNLMQTQHVPITTFLLSDAAATHPDFWRAFLAAGGEIQDHTINHPYMTRLTPALEQAQWQGAADRLHALLGVTPTLARPPYGDVNANVVAAAGHAGLHGVVMWSATMNSGHLATNDNKPLHAGSIVLMHWTSDVWLNVQTVLAQGAAAGLHPALLGPALVQTGY